MTPIRPPRQRRAAPHPGLTFTLILLLASCQSPPSKEGADRAPFADEAYPVGYSLGTFDVRFGISEKDFLRIAKEAKAVWEKPADRPLFRFDREAQFKVNLVYDERQQRTLDARKVKASIDSRGRSYDALVWQHSRRTGRLEEAQRRYDDAAA